MEIHQLTLASLNLPAGTRIAAYVGFAVAAVCLVLALRKRPAPEGKADSETGDAGDDSPLNIGLLIAGFLLAGVSGYLIYATQGQNSLAVITEPVAAEISAQTDQKLRGVKFEGRFELVGARWLPGREPLQLELAWKSLATQPVLFNGVDLVTSDGDNVDDFGYAPSQTGDIVQAGTLWHDVIKIEIAPEDMATVAAVGISMQQADDDLLGVESGPRDWDGERLLIPLPSDVTTGGLLEKADATEIIGWAWNRSDPTETLKVGIYDGETLLATVTAGETRKKLEDDEIFSGHHGFRCATPASIKDGKPHTLHARVDGTTIELTSHLHPVTF